MIVDKIIAYLESEGKTVDEALLDLAGARFKSCVRRQLMSDREEKKFRLMPSNVGKCPKQLSFMVHGHPRKPFNARTRLTFWYGDIVETGVLILAKMAGCDIDLDVGRIETDVGGGYVDGMLRAEGKHVVEVKSMSDIGFREFSNKKLPVSNMWGYVTQCRVYTKAEDALDTVMVGVKKSTGHMDERIVKRADRSVAGTIAVARHATLTDPAAYPRPDFATAKLKHMPRKKCYEIKDPRCKYCDCIDKCFPGVVTEILAKGPVFRVPEAKMHEQPKGEPLAEHAVPIVDMWGASPEPASVRASRARKGR